MSAPTLDLGQYVKTYERTVTVTDGEGDDVVSFDVKYNPSKYNDELLTEISQTDPKAIGSNLMLATSMARKVILAVVTDLGMTINGAKVTVTESNVYNLIPMRLAVVIFTAILKDQTPGKD